LPGVDRGNSGNCGQSCGPFNSASIWCGFNAPNDLRPLGVSICNSVRALSSRCWSRHHELTAPQQSIINRRSHAVRAPERMISHSE
jgi:hypothetical protein